MALNSTINPLSRLSPMVLHWPVALRLDNLQFYEFCRANRDLRIERTAGGDYEIMAPTGGETGWRNARLNAFLTLWADGDGNGVVFDSSTGFVLPNGAIRSPDASWVRKSRLASLTKKQKQGFLPICPDFVIELSSPSDGLLSLQAKMREYIENGAGLGWLIEPGEMQVHVFKPEQPVLVMDNPGYLLGGDLLKGFEFRMDRFWEAEI